MAVITLLRPIHEISAPDRIVTSLPVLDDQYVDAETFLHMGGQSLGDIRKAVAGKRLEGLFGRYYSHLNFETKKMLLFSHEVAANRAFFANSLPLLMPLLSGDEAEQEALSDMLSAQALCPILFGAGETDFLSMLSSLPFELVDRETLVRFYSQADAAVKCYSAALTDGDKARMRNVPLRFRSALFKWDFDPAGKPEDIELLRRQLQPYVPQPIDAAEFRRRMDALEDDVELRHLDRKDVYARHICKPDTRVPDGSYTASPEVFALKLWVDSVYNENMPSLFGYKTLVPQRFPTANELHTLFANEERGSFFADSFLADEHAEMLNRYANQRLNDVMSLELPEAIPYDALSLSDVTLIRQSDIWKRFISALNQYISHKLEADEFISIYYEYTLYVTGFLRKNHLLRGQQKRIPALIDEIVISANAVRTSIKIMMMVGGIFNVYVGGAVMDLGDFLHDLLDSVLEQDAVVETRRSLAMVAADFTEKRTTEFLDMRQFIRFKTFQLNPSQKKQYVQALQALHRRSGPSEHLEGDKVE